jgi:hypothetical protein
VSPAGVQRRAGYRSAQGSGQAEVDAIIALAAKGHQCPHCGGRIVGVHPPESVPADLPQRGSDARVLRALDLESTAARLAAKLAELVPATSFAHWPGRLRLIDASAGTLWMLAPPACASWIRDRFLAVVEQAANDCADTPIRCRIVTAPVVECRTLADLLVDGGAS